MFGTAVYKGETVILIDRVIKKYLIHYGDPIWVDQSELEHISLRKNHPDDKFFEYAEIKNKIFK